MKTTEENNKMIAEFMGHIVEDVNGLYYVSTPFNLKTDRNMRNNFPIHCVRYHTSWDWLMPVVEKIEDLGYDTELVYGLYDGGHCFYINDSPIFSSQMGDKKEATYQAVVQFIEWYNEQK